MMADMFSKRKNVTVDVTNVDQLRNNDVHNENNVDTIIDNLNQKNDFLLENCSDKSSCLTLAEILKSFNAPISEDQGWAIIYQTVIFYRDILIGIKLNKTKTKLYDLKIPINTQNLNIHKDGSVHVNFNDTDINMCAFTSQKKFLLKVAILVYSALDYNLPSDEECIITEELEQLINNMTLEDTDDEGIERDSEDICDEKNIDTKELDHVLEMCLTRIQPSKPQDHYRAVCRALATESFELRIFLQKVFHGDTKKLRINADAQSSKQELAKLGFSDWARFWMQVVDELRRGVRLKKCSSSRTPVEFELTPYEILMEDIRTRKYKLRKVMVNGDIPPRVKKDAHAVILEFIRSRPPLKKASERKLAPLKQNPSIREQLLDSIRQGRVLKPIPGLKNRLLSSSQLETTNGKKPTDISDTSGNLSQTSIINEEPPKSRQRLIPVDFSLFQDDDLLIQPVTATTAAIQQKLDNDSSIKYYTTIPRKKPSDNINNENNPNQINTVIRRTKKITEDSNITHDEYHRFCDNALESYDLATQCESRRASMRRHTIVGCQSNTECQSMPSSRPESRQSSHASQLPVYVADVGRAPGQMITGVTTTVTTSITSANSNQMNGGVNLKPMETWTKNSLDEKQWEEQTSVNDRLSLTLEEIVHIRSVMTKAELEGLPVGIRVKEDVERRKVCFLCLRVRFSIFGQRGVQCKLCQRTVCTKCHSKMRIPTEHFRNVPVVLLSPSLVNSPVVSNTPSPSHHPHITTHASTSIGLRSGEIVDESFSRTLMERLLLRPESERKIRNSVGSAPSSPKHLHSTNSTPGIHDETVVNPMLISLSGPSTSLSSSVVVHNGNMGTAPNSSTLITSNGVLSAKDSKHFASMSRSMEGPRSLPPQSPARTYSNNSTLDRRHRFIKAMTLTSPHSLNGDQKELLRGELMAVCNDCRRLVLEIIRSSKQTRSTARNNALKNLTLDLSPVYKRW